MISIHNFDFDLNYEVVEFTVSTTNEGGYYVSAKSDSNKLTEAQKDLLNSVRVGTRVNFEDVKCKGPDGKIKDIASIVFEIVEEEGF